MKLSKFKEKSLIMGITLAEQTLQSWIRKSLTEKYKLSMLGSLILVALHFEDHSSRAGPSRLSNSLGYSRSRVSQEISKLVEVGYLKRNIGAGDARSVMISLSAQGQKTAGEIIKIFSRLQTLIDRTIGEEHAEKINEALLKLTKSVSHK